MLVLLVSRADPASVTMRDAVLAAGSFSAPETRGGLAVRRSERATLVEIDAMHLDADGVDARIAAALDAPVEAVLVLSKHRSESGRPALTTHAVGNWGPRADFGGRPRALAPAAGRLMSAVLRKLAPHASKRLDVTFEATHHGPLLAAPTAYVEVGSGPAEWTDAGLARLVAEAVLGASAEPAAAPLLVGVGGGHYAPRFTDLARRGAASFGHILPGYALAEALDEPRLLAEAARGCDGFVLDRRGAEPEALDRAASILRGSIREFPEKELSR